MIEKSNSQIGNLVTYRPITVSTVLYRTFTKVLAYKIQEWTENNYIMGEMQSGSEEVAEETIVYSCSPQLSRYRESKTEDSSVLFSMPLEPMTELTELFFGKPSIVRACAPIG